MRSFVSTAPELVNGVPLYFIADQFGGAIGGYSLETNIPLSRFEDPDDRRVLEQNQLIWGKSTIPSIGTPTSSRSPKDSAWA